MTTAVMVKISGRFDSPKTFNVVYSTDLENFNIFIGNSIKVCNTV